jgi:hypothetical protein
MLTRVNIPTCGKTPHTFTIVHMNGPEECNPSLRSGVVVKDKSQFYQTNAVA